MIHACTGVPPAPAKVKLSAGLSAKVARNAVLIRVRGVDRRPIRVRREDLRRRGERRAGEDERPSIGRRLRHRRRTRPAQHRLGPPPARSSREDADGPVLLGRHITDLRSGVNVHASTARSKSGRNARVSPVFRFISIRVQRSASKPARSCRRQDARRRPASTAVHRPRRVRGHLFRLCARRRRSSVKTSLFVLIASTLSVFFANAISRESGENA